jgi:hypothetical protein
MPTHEPEIAAAIERRKKPLNSRIVLNDDHCSYAQALSCPRCGSCYVHNGSSHDCIRGDTHIPFACEGCRSEFELVVIEYDGNGVLIEWREA